MDRVPDHQIRAVNHHVSTGQQAVAERTWHHRTQLRFYHVPPNHSVQKLRILHATTVAVVARI